VPETEPDWNLLPGDPIRFFRLEPDFDRKALRRAYTRLIRTYKPERHPEEFRRIRAAYDQLDEALRYGAPLPSFPPVADPATSVPAASVPKATDRESEAPEEEPAVETLDPLAELRRAGSAGLLRALREPSSPSSADWCRRALVEEAVADDPLALFRTLVQGLCETNGAPELLALLQALLHDGVPPRRIPAVLQALEGLVKPPAGPLVASAYWYLTEPLWLALLPACPFDRFAALLERQARTIGEEGTPGRLVLATRLVRRAAWRADPAWLEATLAELGENYMNLSGPNQEALDLAWHLLQYREQRAEFVGDHPLREDLDRALVAVVEGNTVRADRIFLEVASDCLHEREQLLEALPPDRPAGLAVQILEWYGQDVAARLLEDGEEPRGHGELRSFSARLVHLTEKTLVSKVRHLVNASLFLALLGFVIAPFVVLVAVGSDSVGAWSLLIATMSLLGLGYHRGWYAPVMDRVERPFLRRLHEHRWRPLTADFLSDTQHSLDDVLGYVESLEDRDVNLDDFLGFAAADGGLRLYGVFLRFA